MKNLFNLIHRIGAILFTLVAIGLIITSIVGAFIAPGRYVHCFVMGVVYLFLAWISKSNAEESDEAENNVPSGEIKTIED